MEFIKSYGDSDDSFESNTCAKKFKTAVSVNCAPNIESTQNNERRRFLMDPHDKVVLYNPKYEELYAPLVGPVNPFKNREERTAKNIYIGHVQSAEINDVMFDSQRLTFQQYGYAVNPSIDKTHSEHIGNLDSCQSHDVQSVTEMRAKRVKSSRKKEAKGAADDVENFKGPWAHYVDEIHVSRPNEDQLEILHQWVREKEAKKEVVKRVEAPEIVTESSLLHIGQTIDYQGRSFLVPPQEIGINFRSDEAPERCYLPTKHLFTWRGHTKGITAFTLFPQTGHLMLSGSADTTIKLWEVYRERRLILTYKGHHEPLKDLNFDNDGRRFLSCSLDRYIKLWDTETGSCIQRFTTNKVPNCIRFNPDEDKQNLFIAAMNDKKMIAWDINANEIIQEYDRHLGPVNSITFIEKNQRIFTTSEDRTVRVWEWDIPVDSKYIADPSMHVMPTVSLSPDGRYLACQSLDSKIVIYDVMNRIREKRRKVFRGHTLSGFHCQTCFSPDQKYLISGDGEGKVSIWNFKTTKQLSRFHAHEQAIIGCIWLPHETSKVLTAGMDGLIKLWD